jgi:hypothetical protein
MHRAGYHRPESVELPDSTYMVRPTISAARTLSDAKLNHAYRPSAVELKYVGFDATICRLKHKHPPTHVRWYSSPTLNHTPVSRKEISAVWKRKSSERNATGVRHIVDGAQEPLTRQTVFSSKNSKANPMLCTDRLRDMECASSIKV